jgi:predicted ATPase/class 3 adenylate cyclase
LAHDSVVRDLPDGTVTFLFTDVEGATRLLQEVGAEGYADRLAEHRRVLRGAFQRHGGVEVDTQGDAFFVVFSNAPGALDAVREARRELSLPVRMGLHTGTPLLTEEGYIGTDVHRAARIAAAGHGGQVLVSAETAALVDGVELHDLGEHRLKDLSAPERIFQLGVGEFPPLQTLYRTNLPIPATPFLGREHELAQVRELLERAHVRLLTLSGAGGSGKTRLALQLAGDVAGSYPHGVWWVPLAPLADAAEVEPAAARALGGGAPLAELVGDRRLLLLLDNFEHLVAAAPAVAALLATCPNADVLVTSRERLRVQGEQVYLVPVLDRAEARQLFVARATAAQPDFHSDELVDELCERLDDLPLALELAAARTSLLSTAQLLERLGGRLDLLHSGRDADTRQRTLRATIDWSYELLDPRERWLLVALSVFRGGWTLEAAERVCEADLELLQSLVDKSLVRRWQSGRFGMLETIREFAAERLDAGRDRLLRRLLEYLLDAFEAAMLGPAVSGAPPVELAQAERANVDVALAWATEAGEVNAGLALMRLLERYWATNDPAGGRERVDRLLEAEGADDIEPRVLGDALRVRGATLDMTGRTDLSVPVYERATEIFGSLGDEAEVAHLKHRIAIAALEQDDVERAIQLAGDALEIDRRQGRHHEEAMALNVLSRAAFIQGRPEEGRRLGYDSAAVAERIGFTWWRGLSLLVVAEGLLAAGDTEEAAEALAKGAANLVAEDRVNLPVVFAVAAALAARRDEPSEAGLLWGAVEASAEIEPRPNADQALADYAPYLDPVHGAVFDEARKRGRSLPVDDAVQHLLANLQPSGSTPGGGG